MKIIELFIAFILFIAIGVFAAHNTNYVPISFYPFGFEVEVSAFFLFFVAIVVGTILSSVVYIGKIFHYRRTIRAKDKEIEALKKSQTSLDVIKP